MADFTMRAGDTAPLLTATLLGADGNPANLTGATVKFHLRAKNSATAIVNAVATVVSAIAGSVSYSWQAADTASAGDYWG